MFWILLADTVPATGTIGDFWAKNSYWILPLAAALWPLIWKWLAPNTPIPIINVPNPPVPPVVITDPNPPAPPGPVITVPANHPLIDALVKLIPVLVPILIGSLGHKAVQEAVLKSMSEHADAQDIINATSKTA